MTKAENYNEALAATISHFYHVNADDIELIVGYYFQRLAIMEHSKLSEDRAKPQADDLRQKGCSGTTEDDREEDWLLNTIAIGFSALGGLMVWGVGLSILFQFLLSAPTSDWLADGMVIILVAFAFFVGCILLAFGTRVIRGTL